MTEKAAHIPQGIARGQGGVVRAGSQLCSWDRSLHGVARGIARRQGGVVGAGSQLTEGEEAYVASHEEWRLVHPGSQLTEGEEAYMASYEEWQLVRW